MLGRRVIHKKLWGRSLWGICVAVVMMWLAQFFFIKAVLPGMASSHLTSADPEYVQAVVESNYAFRKWGSRALASLVVAAFLLGIGVRPAPSHLHSRHEKQPLPGEGRSDRFQYRYELYKAQQKWLILLFHDYWRRLFWAGIGTTVLLILTLIVLTVNFELRGA